MVLEPLAGVAVEPALEAGAKNAVEACLQVASGERLMIITHRGSEPISAAIRQAALDRGAVVTVAMVPEGGGGDRFAGQLLSELSTVDVSVLVSTLEGIPVELRRRVVDVGQTRRRHGHMIGITRAVMEQAMRADYGEVERLTERITSRMRPGARLQIESAGGTRLTLDLERGCRPVGASGVLREPGWTNLPGGEVFAVPGTATGVVVPDAGVWTVDGQEFTHAHRLTLEFERGEVTKIDGPPELASKLEAMLEGAGARRLGQVGLGTNTSVVAPIGVLLQDLKLPGVHLTLGHTCPQLTGATFDAAVEAPLMIRRASLTIDGETILVQGKYPAALRD